MKFNKYYEAAGGTGGSTGGPVIFNFEQYDAIVAEMDVLYNKLNNYLESKEFIRSKDYHSGPAKEKLDEVLRSVPKKGFLMSGVVAGLVNNMKQISLNYKSVHEAISNSLESADGGSSKASAGIGDKSLNSNTTTANM